MRKNRYVILPVDFEEAWKVCCLLLFGAKHAQSRTGPLHIPYDVVAGSGYKWAARRAAVRFLGGYNARFWARGPRIWAGTNGRRAGVLSGSGYKSTQSLAGLPLNCNHTRVSGRVLHGTAAIFIENLA